jgi:hypothetical protein
MERPLGGGERYGDSPGQVPTVGTTVLTGAEAVRRNDKVACEHRIDWIEYNDRINNCKWGGKSFVTVVRMLGVRVGFA